MITIYHNPRCRKSREGVAILEALDIDFKIIKYLDTPLNKNELEGIIKILKIQPEALVRKNEAIWKTEFKNTKMTEEDLVNAMIKYPKLIERPIVINGETGVIGRPPALIKTLF